MQFQIHVRIKVLYSRNHWIQGIFTLHVKIIDVPDFEYLNICIFEYLNINIWLIGNQRILESWILWAAAPTHSISVLIQIFKRKPCYSLLSGVKVLRPRVIRLFVCFIVLVFVQLESLFGQKPKLWGFSKIEVELLKCKTFCGKLLYYGHFVMVYLLPDNMCVFKVE